MSFQFSFIIAHETHTIVLQLSVISPFYLHFAISGYFAEFQIFLISFIFNVTSG